MRLKRISVENFRCYPQSFSVEFDDFTAIVGANDVGKSALMDALATFFEEAKLDEDDRCKTGSVGEVRISCIFDDLPSKIVIDDQFETTLVAEHLVNAAGDLEIMKTYAGATPKLKSVDARCMHPTTAGRNDLLVLKRADLVARAEELDVDLTNVNKQANAPIRAAIWENCPDLKKGEQTISLDKEGGKQVWAALGSYLPTFALFKSDRASTDQDDEAQDPLKAAIREALKGVEEELRTVQDYVEAEVKKIADATLAKIKQMDPSLAQTLNPIITTKKWDSLFQTSLTGDQDIPINKRGSGVKRLVLLNFFRAKAEEAAKAKGTSGIIYAVEEPETSQHPRNQRMLLSALAEIASVPGHQVIITTHTPMLARALPDTAIRFIERAENGSRSVSVGGNATNLAIASSLGVLPDHSVRIFIGVEGKHDISFLTGVSRILIAAGHNVPDLEELQLDGKLIFFPFGNLALWSSRLSPLNRPEYHLCDRDCAPPAPPKYHGHIVAVNERAGCKAVTTTRRELENYLHRLAILEAYQANGIELDLPAQFTDFDDVPELVAKAVHHAGNGAEWDNIDPRARSEKISRAKVQLNGPAVARMTAARLDEADANGDVKGWLMDIRDMMDAHS